MTSFKYIFHNQFLKSLQETQDKISHISQKLLYSHDFYND